ncbi:hypothetical protein [Aeromonas salmonicida]|uniref:hypothetical protein n=1 Tax=Aeromonas salmonicida TaxID=645 RepID=UPI0038BD51A9
MSTTADSTADDALDPGTAMWQRLFPDALASCHGLIAHKLTQAIGADVKLGPDLTTLLAPDWQWITHCLDDHLVALPLAIFPCRWHSSMKQPRPCAGNLKAKKR